jgi:prephenate dehydrogenase
VSTPQHVTDAVLRTLDDHARGARAIADALTVKAPMATSLIEMHRREQHAFELLRAEVNAGLLERLEVGRS